MDIIIEVVRIHQLDGSSNVKAFCDISVNQAILIKGLKVVMGKNGLFVSMPSEQSKDGKWYETVKPLNEQAKNAITEAVLTEYTKNNNQTEDINF